MIGTVIWFNPTKGFGFLSNEVPGQPDVFVHQSALRRANLETIKAGSRVRYELELGPNGRQRAYDVVLYEPTPVLKG